MSQQTEKQAVIFQDPKTAVIISFNNEMQKIFDALNQNVAAGGSIMLNFILRLRIVDNKDYEKMKFIQDHIDMEYGINRSIFGSGMGIHGGMGTKEIWDIWRELNNYMNATYFKNYEFGGRPEQSSPTTGRMGSRY